MRNLIIFLVSSSIFSNALACGYSPPSVIKLSHENNGQNGTLRAGDLVEVTLPGTLSGGWRATVKPADDVEFTKLEKVANTKIDQVVLYFETTRSGDSPFKISVKNLQLGKTFTYTFSVRPVPLSGSSCGSSLSPLPVPVPSPIPPELLIPGG